MAVDSLQPLPPQRKKHLNKEPQGATAIVCHHSALRKQGGNELMQNFCHDMEGTASETTGALGRVRLDRPGWAG